MTSTDASHQIRGRSAQHVFDDLRPVATLFRHLGVAALVAEEFNSLFFRNAIKNGLPVPYARQHVSEGDHITVHRSEGWLANGSQRIDVAPLPAMVLDILDAGGLLPRLVADGYLPDRVS